MNRRGMLPLLILIPLILVGLVILYFVLKSLIGLVLTVVLWMVGIVIFGAVVLAMYFIIKWAIKKNKAGKS